MQPELELGDHAEISAAATDGPEQVGVVAWTGAQDPTVSDDDLGGQQIVDGQPGLAAQPPHTPAEGQSAHTGMTHQARRYREAMGLGRGIEVAQQRTTLNPCCLAFGVHDNTIERAQIDDQTVIANRMTRETVRTTTNGNRQSQRSSRPERRHDVSSRAATNDDRWSPIAVGIPRLTRLVVACILGADDRPVDTAPQQLDAPSIVATIPLLLYLHRTRTRCLQATMSAAFSAVKGNCVVGGIRLSAARPRSQTLGVRDRSAVPVALLGVSRLSGAHPAVHGLVPAALSALGCGGGGFGGSRRLGTRRISGRGHPCSFDCGRLTTGWSARSDTGVLGFTHRPLGVELAHRRITPVTLRRRIDPSLLTAAMVRVKYQSRADAGEH